MKKDTDRLLKALMVLSRTVDQVIETRPLRVADEPLSKSKIQVLRLLGRSGMQTSTQVARYLGVTKPAVTQIVDGMLKDKLICRRKSLRDRRGVELTLAERGREVLAAVEEEQRHIVRSAVRGIDARETGRWIELLEEVTVSVARADRNFKQFCLQCGAHADGSCVLVGGDCRCAFLEHQKKHA